MMMMMMMEILRVGEYNYINHVCLRPTHVTMLTKMWTFYHKNVVFGRLRIPPLHSCIN